MKRFALLTADFLPELPKDDRIFLNFLREKGFHADIKIWSQTPASQLRDYDLVIIRSCWDYHRRLSEFLAWVDELGKAGIRLRNSPSILRWNSQKSYLREIESDGIPIVPTAWVSSGSHSLQEALSVARAELGKHSEWVIKPVVSADGKGTFRIKDSETIPEFLESEFSEINEWMIQPFLETIKTDGEVSLLFFDHSFSHAVRKVPGSQDFRVQSQYGGVMHALERKETGSDLVQIGERLLEKCSRRLNGRFLYARVDLMFSNGQPVLGELEVLEPSLYFKTSNEACPNFLDACLRQS